MQTPVHLVWLRHDLRVYDNQALYTACSAAAHDKGIVLALFIATPLSWNAHQMAPLRQDLLRRRVQAMQTELATLNIPLLAVEGSDYASCAPLIAALLPLGVTALYALV